MPCFRKQCATYKSENPEDYAKNKCKNMNFINPVSMTDVEKAIAAKEKGNLTKEGERKVDETIRKGHN